MCTNNYCALTDNVHELVAYLKSTYDFWGLFEAATVSAELGVLSDVSFHGFVSDRARVLDLLRGAHLLMFCHLTDESPRILIEALHAATPLVGFRDAFATGLVDEQGAGLLVERGDLTALADAVAGLAENRAKLHDLVERASRSASHLTRQQVFKHRSDIIKQHLTPVKEAT